MRQRERKRETCGRKRDRWREAESERKKREEREMENMKELNLKVGLLCTYIIFHVIFLTCKFSNEKLTHSLEA